MSENWKSIAGCEPTHFSAMEKRSGFTDFTGAARICGVQGEDRATFATSCFTMYCGTLPIESARDFGDQPDSQLQELDDRSPQCYGLKVSEDVPCVWRCCSAQSIQKPYIPNHGEISSPQHFYGLRKRKNWLLLVRSIITVLRPLLVCTALDTAAQFVGVSEAVASK